jgi:hypothetical protein
MWNAAIDEVTLKFQEKAEEGANRKNFPGARAFVSRP